MSSINTSTSSEALPGAGTDQPAPASPKPAHLFAKTDDPKNRQFTARATESEARRIDAAILANKPDGKPYDIVRLALDLLDHVQSDWFNTFKTQ